MKNFYRKIIFAIFAFFWAISLAEAKWSDFINIRYKWGAGGWSSSDAPEIQCKGLPWCKSWWDSWVENYLPSFIDFFIQIVAVLAVFALIFSWILYMISAGDDEKTKKAKRWIIWSLIWVFLAFSSWWIIALINNIKF